VIPAPDGSDIILEGLIHAVTRAFIVRPFGTQADIDFDRVETDLISPALVKADIEGRTTGDITSQGVATVAQSVGFSR
jgi:hypothetical protein